MRDQKRLVGLRGIGRFRHVNFGRNDAKSFRRHPAYLRRLRAADRRVDAGLGIRMSVDELRARYGVAQ